MDRAKAGEGAKAAIGTRHHTLAPDDGRELPDALRHKFGMFDKKLPMLAQILRD